MFTFWALRWSGRGEETFKIDVYGTQGSLPRIYMALWRLSTELTDSWNRNISHLVLLLKRNAASLELRYIAIQNTSSSARTVQLAKARATAFSARHFKVPPTASVFACLCCFYYPGNQPVRSRTQHSNHDNTTISKY